MSIKRYRFYIDPDTHCFCEMEELADGSYVAHEDYAELEAQERKDIRKISKLEGQLAEAEQDYKFMTDIRDHWLERAEKAEAQLANVKIEVANRVARGDFIRYQHLQAILEDKP